MTRSLLAASTPPLHLPHVDYLSILPVLIMMGGAALLVVASSMTRRTMHAGLATSVTAATSVAAIVAACFQWHSVAQHGAKVTIAGAIVEDGFSVVVQVAVAAAVLLTALVAHGFLEREGVAGPEFHVLGLLSASGAMIMASANDLIVVFLGLEILSIALYVLAAFNFRSARSGEAALKYFVLGGFSSAIFVYGIALVYGATGSTNLPQIADYLTHNVVVDNGSMLAGLALLLVGFGFKVAAVPFHMWSPDVYEGSPSPVAGFMAAVAKLGAFAALLRVFITAFSTSVTDWRPVVIALSVLSMLVGAVLALRQSNVKRMMAYSSVNHAGFILLGLAAASARGVESSLYYVFAYTFMVVGTFAVIAVVTGRGDRRAEVEDLRGLSARNPVLALSFAVLLLAQAGAPFTTGFLAKFQVIAAVVAAHDTWLGVVAMLSAAIAAFFYLRVAVVVYSGARERLGLAGGDAEGADGGTGSGEAVSGPAAEPGGVATAVAPPVTEEEGDSAVADAIPVPRLTSFAIGLALAVTVGMGVIPGPLVYFVHHATLLF